MAQINYVFGVSSSPKMPFQLKYLFISPYLAKTWPFQVFHLPVNASASQAVYLKNSPKSIN